MNKSINRNIKIINDGKKISDKAKIENQKDSKKNTVLQYLIPLIVTIIISLIYIPTQNNILLIPFGISTLVTLFGWDCSSRICSNCKKWNSIIWTQSKKTSKKTNIKKRSIIGKNKTKEITEKITIVRAKCKNCDCEYEIEKNRIF